MIKHNKKKILAIILVFLNIIIICSVNVFAGEEDKKFDTSDYNPSSTVKSISGDGEFFQKASVVVSWISVVGVVILVITLAILGIKFMLGSVEEKAEYKKVVIPILIGVVMFSCTIPIISVFEGIFDESTNKNVEQKCRDCGTLLNVFPNGKVQCPNPECDFRAIM